MADPPQFLFLSFKNGGFSQWGGTYKQKIIYIVDDESVCKALKILLMTFGVGSDEKSL